MRLLAALLALLLLTRAAQAGQLEDGIAAYKAKDYETAYNLLLPYAEQGEAAAQNAIGYMLAFGLGVEKDMARAVDWYRSAADSGDAQAAFSIGVLIRSEEIEPVNGKSAFEWFMLAARRCYPDGIINVAVLYIAGEDVEQDWVAGLAWVHLGNAIRPHYWDEERGDLLRLLTARQVGDAWRLYLNLREELGCIWKY